MNRNIVIFTDCVDIAFNELHQTINGELDKLGINEFKIAPLVAVREFSIEAASFSIRTLADLYPSGSVFLCVVNPTKQLDGDYRIFGETNHGITFVGDNVGYFNWMIKDFGLKYLYKNKITQDKNSKSFGGKQVGAPTVAKIVSGVSLDELGRKASEADLCEFSIPSGTIVYCDNFGLIKIKFDNLDFSNFKVGQKIRIFVNGDYKLDATYAVKWKLQPDGTWVFFSSSSSMGSMAELGKIKSPNSAAELGVKEGDLILFELLN
ncbi:MAG: hypothetical protein BGO77_06225 [Caedibacter sp. 37-49]|nr:MAG: hypothetical protein BGO77_06225 [Caedibacter sp. 37-49]